MKCILVRRRCNNFPSMIFKGSIYGARQIIQSQISNFFSNAYKGKFTKKLNKPLLKTVQKLKESCNHAAKTKTCILN